MSKVILSNLDETCIVERYTLNVLGWQRATDGPSTARAKDGRRAVQRPGRVW